MPIKNRIDMLATGIKTPVGIKVAGPDLDVIAEIGERIERVIGALPGTASVYSERVTGGRYITADVDRLAAARFGLNIADVHDIVRSAIGGMNVGESVEGLERYPINLRYPRDVRESLDDLRTLNVITPGGDQIPLDAVADLRVETGPGVIRTEDARLNGWIYIDVIGEDLGGYVEDAQQAVEENVDLPPGYSLSWSGQYQYMQRAAERLRVVVPAAIGIIVLLLFMNFKNVVSVLIILGTGFIALAGVAVEIGVLMIVYLDQALRHVQQAKAGSDSPVTREDLREAVVNGALLRVRPIIMTVTVIIAGLLPIMLGGGTGSEVMRRIAAPMVGGMVSVTILTLLVIPVIYYLWKGRLLERAPERGVGLEPREAGPR
jgi:Cu(I)/Ag(I) efflux system membrane protein CusA/SilA